MNMSYSQESSPVKSILKASNPVQVTDGLFDPIIPADLLSAQECQSPDEFCSKFSDMKNQGLLTLGINREISFWTLLQWSKNQTTLPPSHPDLINPRINNDSYLHFYKPLAYLLKFGFRNGHSSRETLLGSCLHSLEFLYSIQTRHPRIKKRGDLLPKTQLYNNYTELRSLISFLQAQSSSKPSLIPEINFDEQISVEFRYHFCPENHDPDRIIKRKIHRKIWELAKDSFILKKNTTPTKDQLLDEMEIWDDFINLLSEFATEISKDEGLKLKDIQNILEYCPYMISFAPEIMKLYPVFIEETETYICIELLRELFDFAHDILKKAGQKISFNSILNKMVELKQLVNQAHEHLLSKMCPPTCHQLLQELRKLYYLFVFATDTMTTPETRVSLIFDEMDAWEPRFYQAVTHLGFSDLDLNKFDQELFDQLCEKIYEFIALGEATTEDESGDDDSLRMDKKRPHSQILDDSNDLELSLDLKKSKYS